MASQVLTIVLWISLYFVMTQVARSSAAIAPQPPADVAAEEEAARRKAARKALKKSRNLSLAREKKSGGRRTGTEWDHPKNKSTKRGAARTSKHSRRLAGLMDGLEHDIRFNAHAKWNQKQFERSGGLSVEERETETESPVTSPDRVNSSDNNSNLRGQCANTFMQKGRGSSGSLVSQMGTHGGAGVTQQRYEYSGFLFAYPVSPKRNQTQNSAQIQVSQSSDEESQDESQYMSVSVNSEAEDERSTDVGVPAPGSGSASGRSGPYGGVFGDLRDFQGDSSSSSSCGNASSNAQEEEAHSNAGGVASKKKLAEHRHGNSDPSSLEGGASHASVHAANCVGKPISLGKSSTLYDRPVAVATGSGKSPMRASKKRPRAKVHVV